MTDHTMARKNMVDCQIHTNGVIDPAVLNAFATLPREKFLPADKQNIAYMDDTIITGYDRALLSPMNHARMIQALDIKPDHVVLDIGGGQGYSAAILSYLATTVIALESRQNIINKAIESLQDNQIQNVVNVKSKLTDGYKDQAPYDAVFINGAISEIPENIIAQLAPKGRMTFILKSDKMAVGQAILLQNGDNNGYSTRVLFETNEPFLAGFEPKPAFTF